MKLGPIIAATFTAIIRAANLNAQVEENDLSFLDDHYFGTNHEEPYYPNSSGHSAGPYGHSTPGPYNDVSPSHHNHNIPVHVYEPERHYTPPPPDYHPYRPNERVEEPDPIYYAPTAEYHDNVPGGEFKHGV